MAAKNGAGDMSDDPKEQENAAVTAFRQGPMAFVVGLFGQVRDGQMVTASLKGVSVPRLYQVVAAIDNGSFGIAQHPRKDDSGRWIVRWVEIDGTPKFVDKPTGFVGYDFIVDDSEGTYKVVLIIHHVGPESEG